MDGEYSPTLSSRFLPPSLPFSLPSSSSSFPPPLPLPPLPPPPLPPSLPPSHPPSLHSLLAKPGTPLQIGDLLFLRRSLFLSLLRAHVSSPLLYHDQILSIHDLENEDEGGREGGRNSLENGGGKEGGRGRGRVRVVLKSGKEEEVDLVVGADGMFSPLLREEILGLPPPVKRGYTVYRGVFEGRSLQPGFSFQVRPCLPSLPPSLPPSLSISRNGHGCTCAHLTLFSPRPPSLPPSLPSPSRPGALPPASLPSLSLTAKPGLLLLPTPTAAAAAAA